MIELLARVARARMLREISKGFVDSTLNSNGFLHLCHTRGSFNYIEDM